MELLWGKGVPPLSCISTIVGEVTLPMLARSLPLGLVPKGPRGNPSGARGTGTGATGGSWPIGGDLYKHLHTIVHVDRPLD